MIPTLFRGRPPRGGLKGPRREPPGSIIIKPTGLRCVNLSWDLATKLDTQRWDDSLCLGSCEAANIACKPFCVTSGGLNCHEPASTMLLGGISGVVRRKTEQFMSYKILLWYG